MERWLSILVESRAFSTVASAIEVCSGRGVPYYAKAVHVEQSVAGCDFMFGCYLVLVVREELGDRELFGRGRETRCEKSASRA